MGYFRFYLYFLEVFGVCRRRQRRSIPGRFSETKQIDRGVRFTFGDDSLSFPSRLFIGLVCCGVRQGHSAASRRAQLKAQTSSISSPYQILLFHFHTKQIHKITLVTSISLPSYLLQCPTNPVIHISSAKSDRWKSRRRRNAINGQIT